MNTSTKPLRPALEAIADGDRSSAATMHPDDTAAAARPHGPDGELDRTVVVLPDVVQLPWEPYYLEPPD